MNIEYIIKKIKDTLENAKINWEQNLVEFERKNDNEESIRQNVETSVGLKYNLPPEAIQQITQQIKLIVGPETELQKNVKNNLNARLDLLYQAFKFVENTVASNELFDDFDIIIDALETSIQSKKDVLDIMCLLFEYNVLKGEELSKVEQKIETQSDADKKYKNLTITDEELIKIFAMHNKNFDLVSNEMKQKFRVYGNIKDINLVFNFLEKHNIYFKETDNKILEIICKSNETILNLMEDIANNYGLEIEQIIKNAPSSFLHKIIGKHKLNGEKKSSSTHEIVLSGSHEDFVRNVELFSSLGFDIQDSFATCSTIFTSKYETNKNTIAALRNYGIEVTPNSGFCLSGIIYGYAINNLDRFIEIGEYDYIKQNTSRLCLRPSSPLLHRLFYVKKKNEEYPANKLEYKSLRAGKYTYRSEITSEKETYLDSIMVEKPIEEYRKYIINQFVDKEFSEILDSVEEYKLSENDYVIQTLDSKYLDTENHGAYNFNGILISRNKMIRNYNALKDSDQPLKIILIFAAAYKKQITAIDLGKLIDSIYFVDIECGLDKIAKSLGE